MQIQLSSTHTVTLRPLPGIYNTKQSNLNMTNKLNLLEVEKYSKSFAEKVCDNFYVHATMIDGKQLLNLTSVQQVNMLVVRELYEKWQAENQRLRSPYFDYEHPEVKDALEKFMNTLSQFISVKRIDLEPLLAKATKETFWLMLQPHKFYSETFRELPNFKLTSDDVNQLSKYVQINKSLLPPIADKLNDNEYVFVNQAIDWLDDIIEKTSLEESGKYWLLFSETLPIPEELFEKETLILNPVIEENITAKNGSSFFDNLLPKEEYRPIIAPEPEKIEVNTIIPAITQPIFEERIVKPVIEQPIVETKKVMQESVSEIIVANPLPSFIQVPAPPFTESHLRDRKKIENIRLNDHLGIEQRTINDHNTSNHTVSDLHKTRKIEDIGYAISLNQRFLFINHLFKGNTETYINAIQELDDCQTFGAAKEILLKKYVPTYNWDIKSAEAEEFIDIVRRRFS